MAVQSTAFTMTSLTTTTKSVVVDRKSAFCSGNWHVRFSSASGCLTLSSRSVSPRILALASDGKGGSVPNTNYVVPLDKSPTSSCITRPLAEILRDLNKRIPDNILQPGSITIPWYHANRMLSFYAPGWCGEIRDVIFSNNRSVTVVYRVTVRGSDGEAFRESSGTVLLNEIDAGDPVASAEQIAFVKACARFGLGLYLYHD
ncbi:hypothetical protein V2J09_014574 [Rumex salicifolius]